MTEENFILVSLDDSKSKEISEILGSKTCKKIINYLSENSEASEKDLSENLKIPINTVEYNLKKLTSSGFVQKRKNFFWSKKGKKIPMYELSNKSVVISHKKPNLEKVKSIIPAFLLTAVGSFALWVSEKINAVPQGMKMNVDSVYTVAEEFEKLASEPVRTLISPQATPLWAWFLAGSLLAIIIISIVNWRKL